MYIRQLELHNFRQYKGTNTIDLETEQGKNILIVSGMNGFGKTNFLISLVWCLYGGNTEKVDEFFKKLIDEQGGYKRYIANSLNWSAKSEGESLFYVSITFTDVEITAVPCQTIKIIRYYDINSSQPEKLEILFDGQTNELVQQEYGYELFIRDFLIPLETAKFFFFDAEKIVSLAEANSIEQRRELSKAYSEVLGIQKYEDLRESLEEMQRRFTKESATPTDRKRLIELEKHLEQNDIDLQSKDKEIDELKEKNQSLRYESNQYQNKLIKEGNKITLDELQELRRRHDEIEQNNTKVLGELRDFLDFAPFAIAGETMLDISEQVEEEYNSKRLKFQSDEVDNKIEEILAELDEEKVEFKRKNQNEVLRTAVSEFYNHAIRNLIKKHFFNNVSEGASTVHHLHDLLETERNELNTLLNNLKHSYKQRFKSTTKEYNTLRSEKNGIAKKLRDAESNEEDPIISDYRRRKAEIDSEIIRNSERVDKLNQDIGGISNQQNSIKAEISELSKKVEIATQLKVKHELTKRLLGQLKEFIIRYKEEKKKSLAERILSSLNTLMHKDLIKSVEVEMIGEDIEIHLRDRHGREVPKESLSKGEQQLYATSLLKALVEESSINFPVFVDSPMQKFDAKHADNVIQYFYPNISDQVVIFPLLYKELTTDEYKKLKNHVAKSYLIHNLKEGHSTFLSVPNNDIFEKYNELCNGD
jgi:DNA sulfur modification protein DndD